MASITINIRESNDYPGVPLDAKVEEQSQSSAVQSIYKNATVAPKWLCWGIGWALGLLYAGSLGAEVGAEVGTVVGAMGALGVELAFGKYFGFDRALTKQTWTAIVAHRLQAGAALSGHELEKHTCPTMAVSRIQSVLAVSAGCLLAGAFLHHLEMMGAEELEGAHDAVSVLTTYVGAALTYIVGATGMRCLAMYPWDQKERHHWRHHFREDVQTGFYSIGPTEGCFQILQPSRLVQGARLFSAHTWEVLQQSSRAMFTGGVIGTLLKKGVEKSRQFFRR